MTFSDIFYGQSVLTVLLTTILLVCFFVYVWRRSRLGRRR